MTIAAITRNKSRKNRIPKAMALFLSVLSTASTKIEKNINNKYMEFYPVMSESIFISIPEIKDRNTDFVFDGVKYKMMLAMMELLNVMFFQK